MPVQDHLVFSFQGGFSHLLEELAATHLPLVASVDRLVLGPAAHSVPQLGPFTIPYLPIKHQMDSYIWCLSLIRSLMAQLSVLLGSFI